MSRAWLARRIILIGYTLLIVSLLVFGITQALPADAAVTMLGESATQASLAALRAKLGLNDPVWLQYWHWASGVLQGDFGVSTRTNQPVGPMMLLALSRSLLLAGCAIVVVLLIGLPLGIGAALARGSMIDVLSSVVAYLGVSLPEFVTATLLLTVLADRLRWLPATGYVPLGDDLAGGVRHLALPVLTVSLVLVAHVSRMARSEMIDVLQSDYIRAARLKGIGGAALLVRHALRNALLPVVTVIALDIGYLLGGIIVVEEIFALPGIGRALIAAIETRDIPAIQAGALIMATTYAVASFLSDLLYAALDKRIRYD